MNIYLCYVTGNKAKCPYMYKNSKKGQTLEIMGQAAHNMSYKSALHREHVLQVSFTSLEN